MFGFDRVKPLQMYINKLVKKGRLPQELAAAEYEGNDMEEDFQLDEKIAGLVTKSKSLGSKRSQTSLPYGILKQGLQSWSFLTGMENRTCRPWSPHHNKGRLQ